MDNSAPPPRRCRMSERSPGSGVMGPDQGGIAQNELSGARADGPGLDRGDRPCTQSGVSMESDQDRRLTAAQIPQQVLLPGQIVGTRDAVAGAVEVVGI